MYRIGIDVGGTNTDAVILDEHHQPIAKVKQPTTPDVTTGIFNALDHVLNQITINYDEIQYAMLGTTHCTNAIVERKRLNKVAIIRIGKPATLAIEPLTAWSRALKDAIGEYAYIVSGGYECDGRKISTLHEKEILNITQEIKGKVDSVAVVGVFSPVNAEQEKRVGEIVIQELGADMAVSLSHEIGSLGLLERENATVLNGAIIDVAKTAANAFRNALEEKGIHAKLFFGQNDGTLMSVDYAIKYPILTIACGPTNSIRGAAFLSQLKDAIIVDVGGTTTDIGILVNGFPRESSVAAEIGGVMTNFRMPDLISVGLGGGTIIREQSDEITIGPDSVGYRLAEEALIFGGKTLTVSDVAVASGRAEFGTKNYVESLNTDLVREVNARIVAMVEDAIDKMKTSAEPVPVVLVGGGSIILPEKLEGASEVVKPDHFEVANAIGAAIAQVSGEIEKIFSLEKMSREEAVNTAKALATDQAIEAGAQPDTIEVVDLEDIPLAYLPGNVTRIRIKVAGDLADS